jgi:hypothetical protein
MRTGLEYNVLKARKRGQESYMINNQGKMCFYKWLYVSITYSCLLPKNENNVTKGSLSKARGI